MSGDAALLERNAKLYGWYLPLSGSYFWAPVFFLFFSERFPIQQIFELQALYYFTVVLLEVPSGYLSDRVGRTTTLRLSAAAAVLAYVLFLIGETFFVFSAAQMAIAVSFSFASGTDAAFHYDTLAGLSRSEEFGDREARIRRNAFLAGSATALTGGAVGVFDLSVAYALSLLVAFVNLGVVLAMREPPRGEDGWAEPHFGRQLVSCVQQLRSPLLAWLFAYVVLQTTLEHVPYEFAQPYLAAVLGESAAEVSRTPLATGVLAAGIAAVAAFASARSVKLEARVGLVKALVGVTALQTLLISAMAAVVHPLVVPFIALRSVQGAVGKVLVNKAVTPRIRQAQRATYLSLHSLAGRIGYGSVLYALGTLAGSEAPNDAETITRLLRACALLAVVGLAALAVTSGAVRRGAAQETAAPLR